MLSRITEFDFPSRDQVGIWLTAPVIYSLIIPVALLHGFMFIYQAICFPAYGVLPIDSKKYIKDVRAKLPYLTPMQKVNCWYCSYANGVIAFAAAVAKETEKVWCPIKNKITEEEFDLSHRKDFAEHNDPVALEEYKENNQTLL